MTNEESNPLSESTIAPPDQPAASIPSLSAATPSLSSTDGLAPFADAGGDSGGWGAPSAGGDLGGGPSWTDATPVARAEAVVLPALPQALEPEAAKGGDLWGAVREIAETVILTLIIFFLVRAVLENYRVEGQSMEPNLETGQYLIVNKVQYHLRPAERGDIIVFIAPKSPDKNFVKRIIGLPGEKVEIRGGEVLINGQVLYEPYIDNRWGYTYGPVTVGPDELFVLGDNRNNSSDSHSWGMLPEANVIGKAWVCYWPPEKWGFVPHYALALK
jgi:signal peptidase I